jgi:hypothetical protein
MKSDEPMGEDRTEKVNPDEEAMNPESRGLAPETPTTHTPAPIQDEEPQQGLWAQIRARLNKPPDSGRDGKSVERTRGLVMLAGTAIVCIFLFFGLFTTDSSTTRKERWVTPSLGRPEAAAVDPESANRSPVPQLSVNQQPNEETGELSEQDLLGTMRNRGTPPPPDTPPPPSPERTLRAVNFDDPALIEAYRRQGLVPPAQRPPVTQVSATVAEPPPRQTALPAPAPPINAVDELRQSSIVFVRTAAQTSAAQATPVPTLTRKPTTLLPQGTALVARLQHAVSSAAKVPVTAVVEYNYEESGQLVLPAGTKAYGELAQTTPQGWVTIKFHSLEFPNGHQEEINGSAISMERTALRGDVNGKNGAKKFLTRTLTGIGTIAAFAVGGRGLTGGIDNSILLRERLASNIALAGEQELAMMAYQQNIVVTVPANTRFYLVLQEAGVSRPPEIMPQPASQQMTSTTLQQTATRSVLSDQEMRELVQLRNELREMNRLMQLSTPRPESSVSENR